MSGEDRQKEGGRSVVWLVVGNSGMPLTEQWCSPCRARRNRVLTTACIGSRRVGWHPDHGEFELVQHYIRWAQCRVSNRKAPEE